MISWVEGIIIVKGDLPLLPSYKWIIVVDGAIPSKKYFGVIGFKKGYTLSGKLCEGY